MSGYRFKDQAVIITGAGSGVGAATAHRLAKEGAELVLVDLVAEPLNMVVDSVCRLGTRAVGLVGDVRNESTSRQAVERAISEYGRLDVFVANAGVQLHQRDRPVHELDSGTWEETIAVNARGVFLGCKAAVRAMLQHSGGVIVIVGSVTALSAANHRHHAYVASKGSITALSRAIAAAYGAQGIRCNVVAPGVLISPPNAATEVPDDADELELARHNEAKAAFINSIPLRRTGAFDEVASVIAFLGSSDASYVTGATVVVDGGLLSI